MKTHIESIHEKKKNVVNSFGIEELINFQKCIVDGFQVIEKNFRDELLLDKNFNVQNI